ncbi:amidohydrolase family protein [Thermomonospora umbrina]|uniref:Amidohydrolase family protein n=1 Tax=Thermomonospora umbrina TaxID=111806 RepID=A0A3D9SWJ9_9ACTN|nr:amidohydrolase family protein [Thermomonospora umbrina]REE98890.1 amidohydrolase family protein [Thermomonospora umbrina]
MTCVDVHQHGWGPRLVEALRARGEPPFLRGWTLYLHGEPPYSVDPADHELPARAALARADGLDVALLSLSSPLGIEWLPPNESTPLLAAHHEDATALPAPFAAWASACLTDVDPRALDRALDHGFVGLQLPADALADAAGHRHCGPLLDVLEARDLPLFIHPGAAHAPRGLRDPAPEEPGWWAAMVPYVQQMHAAWFAFRAFGRPAHPRLRVCFTMLAGLAPLHGERLAARGGGRGAVDMDAFVETSSYGPRAVDAVVRALGVDVIVHGSDRPYASPRDPELGDAARHAFRNVNPRRLLTGN